MPEFKYAKGRIDESIQFISEEMKEFEQDYAGRTWQEYQSDRKLQKLIDRTVENILTALIEVCGTINSSRGVGVVSYSDAIQKTTEWLGFSEIEQRDLARLAIQRNRLAHRYLNSRWQAVKMFKEQKGLIIRMITEILAKVAGGEPGNDRLKRDSERE
jgi:uncharacterized protein YutE (UPF0331/DUF86 family)